MEFVRGQRWYSVTEPELGLGIVEAVEGRQVVIAFPARTVTRRYAVADPPLVRAQLSVGQKARGGGVGFIVEQIVEEVGLFHYRGENRELSESELEADLDVATPENRLLNSQVDDFRLFDLRREALQIRHRLLSSSARGFLGGRIRLFDHQLYIAQEVCDRHRLRVLLADEVGLGKTIEALLILHRLLLTGRVENVLILVPPSLVHQWLAEAYLRFNLVLRVMGEDTHGGGTIDLESEDLPEQLLVAQLFVCPLDADLGDSFSQTRWDMVIVDEVHHLRPGTEAYALVDSLAARTEHVVFLSASPDRDGEEAHFHRLALLDPARYHDIDAYRSESSHYRELASVAERLANDEPLEDEDRELLRRRLANVEDLLDRGHNQQLLRQLLDLHGIGRLMFRNVRARIPGFPNRISQVVRLPGDPEPLRREFLADIGRDDGFALENIESDPRSSWLATFLDEHPAEKVLVLCANAAKVETFSQALETPKRQVARFHEEMGVVQRDRQAAWFLDEDGPQVVISSAIGAEGRNFQVASHLVLLDLPLHADRLEQSIGRIDRIGQGEKVFIYPVVVEGTPQAGLARWYSEALQIFERPWHGSPVVERELGTQLLEGVLDGDERKLNAVISDGNSRNAEIINELETGRDRLLELTSFDKATAHQLQQTITELEANKDLEQFMVSAFERGGLDVEDIGERSYALRAGMDYHRPFPGFVGFEMAVTFDRDLALEHPDRSLLTWDHPMVRDSLDILLSHELGNASIASMNGGAAGLLLETLFVAEPMLDQHLRADRFLPPTPIRVVVDSAGKETELDPEEAIANLKPMAAATLQLPQVEAILPKLIEDARKIAEARTVVISEQAHQKLREVLEPVVGRLSELAKVNPAVSQEEIDAVERGVIALDEGLSRTRVRLDGLRLILVAPELSN